jgi:hypothetical protein
VISWRASGRSAISRSPSQPYPEKHPERPRSTADIDALKAKVDCGATRAITQFFFDNDLYLRFLDKVRARGIDIPIVPGILPVQNFKQAKSFAERAGASMPDWLAARFDGLEHDLETRKLIAAAVAAEQVLDLVDRGVNEFHFYTMNRADLVFAVCHLLGLRAEVSAAPRARGSLAPRCQSGARRRREPGIHDRASPDIIEKTSRSSAIVGSGFGPSARPGTTWDKPGDFIVVRHRLRSSHRGPRAHPRHGRGDGHRNSGAEALGGRFQGRTLPRSRARSARQQRSPDPDSA